MRLVRGFLAVVVLSGAAASAACGGGVSVPPPKPPSVEHSMTADVPKFAPLQPGEQLVAEADVLGVSIGSLDMQLKETCAGEHSGEWVIDSKLGTSGVLSWFNKTQGRNTTFFDKATLRPRRSVTTVVDGDEWRRYRLDFIESGFRYVYEKSDGDKKEGEELTPDAEPVYDTQTAYVLLRSWQPKPHELSYFYVALGKDLWRSDVRYHGRSKMDFQGKSTPVLHFKGTAHRINLKPGDEYTPRVFALWLTDDERRIPVKVVGDGSLGSVSFGLSKWKLGEPCLSEGGAESAEAPAKEAVEAPQATAVHGAEEVASEGAANEKAANKDAASAKEPASGSEPGGAAQEPALDGSGTLK